MAGAGSAPPRVPRGGGQPGQRNWLANSTSRMPLLTTTPIIIKAPIRDWMLSVVPVAYRTTTPREAERHGDHDDERINERAELSEHHQIHQGRRDHQADDQHPSPDRIVWSGPRMVVVTPFSSDKVARTRSTSARPS